ncbi:MULTISPECIES: dethiobiotin synthase [unclassified Agarivorans]|uniref:dethiobiotin synthase n=1 Tax=unclassified Agarivorans TaxID=2636026 RepID=UPI003D7C59C6
MIKSVFITGTDTEVGKTLVSCALMLALQRQNTQLVVNGFKPLAAGAEQGPDGLNNEDGLAIQQYTSLPLSYQQVNPVTLQQAIAPHIAARLENAPIDIAAMDSGLDLLQAQSDILLVEGAGGWHVPLDDQQATFSQWVVKHQLPVILVVGVKLGCLNHALLTVEAIKASGVKLLAWVANHLSDDSEIATLNIEYLKNAITAPCIATIPYKTKVNPELIENYFDLRVFHGAI